MIIMAWHPHRPPFVRAHLFPSPELPHSSLSCLFYHLAASGVPTRARCPPGPVRPWPASSGYVFPKRRWRRYDSSSQFSMKVRKSSSRWLTPPSNSAPLITLMASQ